MINLYHSLHEVPRSDRTVATLGTFDGVHLGHQVIIRGVVEKARAIGGRSLVITFHPHPPSVLRKTGDSVPILSTIEERVTEMEKLGVDAMVVLAFTPEFAATPWQEFCRQLVAEIGVAHMIVGHDHAFGRNREGNAESLKAFGIDHGFTVEEAGPFVLGEETVSSTKIRRALQSGDLERGTSFLGRRYRLTGTVVRGDGRGRQLGIPTANIHPASPEKLVPADGVYCVGVEVDGVWFSGMANIGLRPTFTDASRRTIEVNLFDFDRDIYERSVTVEFRKFVRSERKFASKEEFLAQLERDRGTCRGDAPER
jgi:riboflavin kinase/FMN adenylyltransferase